jgi:hypothetical protein
MPSTIADGVFEVGKGTGPLTWVDSLLGAKQIASLIILLIIADRRAG